MKGSDNQLERSEELDVLRSGSEDPNDNVRANTPDSGARMGLIIRKQDACSANMVTNSPNAMSIVCLCVSPWPRQIRTGRPLEGNIGRWDE